MARKVDNIIKWIFWFLPAFTHENTVNRLFFDKIVELNDFIVDRARVNVNDSREDKSFNEFVGSFNSLDIFVKNFIWFCFNHLSFIYNDRNGLVFLMICII